MTAAADRIKPGSIVGWSNVSPLYVPRERLAVVDDRDPSGRGLVLCQSSKGWSRWIHPDHLRFIRQEEP